MIEFIQLARRDHTNMCSTATLEVPDDMDENGDFINSVTAPEIPPEILDEDEFDADEFDAIQPSTAL